MTETSSEDKDINDNVVIFIFQDFCRWKETEGLLGYLARTSSFGLRKLFTFFDVRAYPTTTFVFLLSPSEAEAWESFFCPSSLPSDLHFKPLSATISNLSFELCKTMNCFFCCGCWRSNGALLTTEEEHGDFSSKAMASCCRFSAMRSFIRHKLEEVCVRDKTGK